MEKCVAVHPEALDVLCGSGLFVRTHQGNLRLQRIIKENFDAYFNAPSRPCMSDIVHSIVREVIHGNGVRKSRVLKKEAIFSYWYVVAKKEAPKVLRDKITSCLRDMSKKLEAQVTPLRWNDRQMHHYAGAESIICRNREDDRLDNTIPIAGEKSGDPRYDEVFHTQRRLMNGSNALDEQRLPAVRSIQEMMLVPLRHSLAAQSTDDKWIRELLLSEDISSSGIQNGDFNSQNSESRRRSLLDDITDPLFLHSQTVVCGDLINFTDMRCSKHSSQPSFRKDPVKCNSSPKMTPSGTPSW